MTRGSDTWAADYEETRNLGGQGVGPNLANAQRVLRAYLGTDQVHVVIDSAPTGLAHVHEDVDALETEIIAARIYGGMHYRTSMNVGLEMGHSVADQLTQNFFQPRPE